MAKRLKAVRQQTVHRKPQPPSKEVESLLNTLTDASFSLNRRWEFTSFSPKAERLLSKLHLTPRALLGKNIWATFPDTKQSHGYQLFQKAVQQRQPVQFEAYYAPLDTWFETYVHPSRDRIDVYLHDITARKKAEEALRESEERYRLLVEHSPDAIAVLCEDAVVYANSKALMLIGASHPEDLIGQPVLRFVHPDFHAQVQTQMRYLLLRRKPLPVLVEQRFLRLDGTAIDVQVAAIPLTYNGQPAIQIVVRDITEWKNTEARLHDALQFNEQIISTAGQGIIVYDTELRYVVWNSFMEQLTGMSATEVLGRTAVELFPHLREQGVYDLLLRTVAGETTQSGDVYFFVPQTGKSGWVMGTYVPHRNARGQIIGVIGVITDISGRKRMEQALLKSEERLRTFIAQSTEGIYRFDLRKPMPVDLPEKEQIEHLYKYGYHAECNAVMAKMYGFDTPDEFIGKTPSDLLPLSDPQNVEYLRSFVRSHYRLTDAESHERDKDGNIKYFLNNVVGIVENGYLTHVWGTQRDITEQKKAYEALRASEEQYRTLFENVLDGVFQSTPDGRLLAANPALVRMLGYDSEEELRSLDIPSTFYVHPEQRKEICRQLEEHGEVRNAELQLRRKDGTQITVLENSRVIRNEQGVTLYYEGTLTDITQLKAAQEAIAESEQQYRSLIEQSNDAIYLLSEGKFDLVNKKFTEMLGVTPEEVRQPEFNFMELVAPESIPLIEERQRMLARGEEPPLRYEFVARARDGRRIPVEASVSYITYKGRRAVQGILRDITERKHAEEGLKQMLSILQSTLESTADGILLVDLYGKIITFNRKFAQMWRIPQEILDTGDDDRVLAFVLDQLVDPQGFLTKVRELYSQPTAESFDVLEFKDGRVFERYSIPQLVEGKAVGRVWSFRDVTTRRHAELALRQSEEKFRTLFEESKDAIYMSTVDGRFLDINPAGVELFGYASKEEILAVDIARDLYAHPSDRIRFQRLIEQNGFVRDYEITLRTKSGELRTVLETSTAVRNPQGEIVAYRGIIRDITERKRLEEQLRQAHKLQSLGTLAGGIAHDFNNILGIILGYAGRLSRETSNPDRLSRSIDAITKAGERGAALVRQLLTFARQTDVQWESVHLNTIVEEVARIIRETFPKSISLSLELAHNLPSIVGDSNQLHQALLNLVLNAKDAISQTGQITLATEVVDGAKLRRHHAKAVDESYVCLRVSDTGTGMDAATLNRIFEPFFTTKRRGSGTGLGLAVVYGIVESHRGFIDVASEVGRGTTFRLYFPTPQINIQKIEEASQAYQEIPGGTETILVVEDEEMLLELLKSTLEAKGYHVVFAHDGVEAVDLYQQYQQEIAVVISDIGLPRLTGIELCRELKKINPSVKVALASGYLDQAMKQELASVDAKVFIQKPYNPDAVLRQVRAMIDS